MRALRTGIKNGQGLESRLLAYFNANPDEELAFDDIEAKFEVSHQRAYNAVKNLRQYGVGRVVVVRRLPAQPPLIAFASEAA